MLDIDRFHQRGKERTISTVSTVLRQRNFDDEKHERKSLFERDRPIVVTNSYALKKYVKKSYSALTHIHAHKDILCSLP